MTHEYGIISHATIDGRYRDIRYRSTDILAAFAHNALAVPESLTRLTDEGCHYSYEDFDVLAAALNVLRSHGVSEIPYTVL